MLFVEPVRRDFAELSMPVSPVDHRAFGMPWSYWVQTGLTMAEHPIERLRAAGVLVSVNTDDPELLGASLIGEYSLCRQAFGWTDGMTKAVARTSIEASFANPDIKTNLLKALGTW